MPVFNIVVVGAGGGPDETNLSAYLLKPSHSNWKDGILAIEAGSSQGALSRILKSNPALFTPESPSASAIYSYVRAFLITHAHLDHLSGLVLSAGSLEGPRKRIYATKAILEDIATVFSGRLWPKLASWNEKDPSYNMLYTALDIGYTSVFPGISVRHFPLSHGQCDGDIYHSTAFFIRDDASQEEILFFGDVEPDSLNKLHLTRKVWKAAAPKIPHKLSAIFIECSYPSGRPDDMLFGHLTPDHLVEELGVLAEEVVKCRKSTIPTRQPRKRRKSLGPLSGLKIYITHCKSSGDKSYEECRKLIAKQTQDLVRAKGLDAEVVSCQQGMKITI